MSESFKRLRRYSDAQVKELVKDTYIARARVYQSPEEAERMWSRLPEETRSLLEDITVSVYRSIWYADEKRKKG